jgi:hypothetical protein
MGLSDVYWFNRPFKYVKGFKIFGLWEDFLVLIYS